MAQTDDFFNRWGIGDRQGVNNTTKMGSAVITAVNTNWAPNFSTTWDQAVDGSVSSGPVITTTPTVDTSYFEYVFDQPFKMTGWAVYGGDTQDFGVYKLYGSNDGVSYNYITDLHWNNVASGCTVIPSNTVTGLSETWTNTTAYDHYKFIYHSGWIAAGRLCFELLFRATHSDLDGGDRNSVITISTNMTENFSNPATYLLDEEQPQYWSSPTAALIYQIIVSGTSYMQWEFPSPVVMRDTIWMAQKGGSTAQWGSWQWQRSDDGSTWTDEGAPFDFGLDGFVHDFSLQIPSPGGTTGAKFWQMLATSSTRVDNTFFSEIIFNVDEPTDVWASVEAPDTFAALGYVGAFGATGFMASNEAPDAFVGAGYPNLFGTFFVTEAPDRFSAFGFQPLSGVWVSTETPDKFHAVGLGVGVNGVWQSTEAVDICTMSGMVPIVGTLAVTEPPDHFFAVGAGVTQVHRRRTRFVT